MRDLIKIIITLVFIAGAFWVGNYVANKKCSTQVNELNAKYKMDRKHILQLYDSLGILKMELGKEKTKRSIDALKPKQAVKQKK